MRPLLADYRDQVSDNCWQSIFHLGSFTLRPFAFFSNSCNRKQTVLIIVRSVWWEQRCRSFLFNRPKSWQWTVRIRFFFFFFSILIWELFWWNVTSDERSVPLFFFLIFIYLPLSYELIKIGFPVKPRKWDWPPIFIPALHLPDDRFLVEHF